MAGLGGSHEMFRVVGVMAAILVAVWFFAGERVFGLFGDGPAALRPGGSPMSSGPKQPAPGLSAPSVGDPERAAPTPASPAEPQREIIRFVTAGGTLGMVEHDSEIPAGARILGRTVMSARSEGRPAAAVVASAEGGNGNKVRAKQEREADSRQQADKWHDIVRDALRNYSDMASRVNQERKNFITCEQFSNCSTTLHAEEIAWLEMQRLYEYLTTTIFRECALAGCEREWILPRTEMEHSVWDTVEREHKKLADDYERYREDAAKRLAAKRLQDENRPQRADQIR